MRLGLPTTFSVRYIHMRVLLSDGSGLTARQCATRLSADGHAVDVLSPDPMCLCRFTRSVHRVHRVPPYGADPLQWLDTALEVYRSGRFDVLFPTQEQVAVLSWAKSRLEKARVATTVPSFAALAAVQDKISASATLCRLGIPQPPSAIGIEGWDRFPAFVKDPIGTASGASVGSPPPRELQGAATGKPVLVQAAVDGPLIMCQSVFDHGSLVAFHANERTTEGAGGGASHKTSVSMPDARRLFEILGGDLRWHGALSADLILGDDGPVFIDVNPRLVEPQNAYFSGVDLVRAMMELAADGHPATQPDGRKGVATHQLLLSVLGAAQHGGGRLGVVAEVLHAGRRNHDYLASREELTPVAHDRKALVPLAMAAAATIAVPRSWSWFTSGSVSNYALTGEGWDQLLKTDPSHQYDRKRSGPGLTEARRSRRSGLRTGSRTAELMAVQRGLESARPPRTRLFEDPLAGSFASLPWRIAARRCRFPLARQAIEAGYDLIGGPGPRASAIARTKLIDDLLEHLAPSVDQVVILGAGYDTRPYRLAGLSSCAVFEVDHPSTQAVKRSVLRRTGTVTTSVAFVPVDFEIDDLAEALLDAGTRRIGRPCSFGRASPSTCPATPSTPPSRSSGTSPLAGASWCSPTWTAPSYVVSSRRSPKPTDGSGAWTSAANRGSSVSPPPRPRLPGRTRLPSHRRPVDHASRGPLLRPERPARRRIGPLSRRDGNIDLRNSKMKPLSSTYSHGGLRVP